MRPELVAECTRRSPKTVMGEGRGTQSAPMCHTTNHLQGAKAPLPLFSGVIDSNTRGSTILAVCRGSTIVLYVLDYCSLYCSMTVFAYTVQPLSAAHAPRIRP